MLLALLFACATGDSGGPLVQLSTQVAYDTQGRLVDGVCPVTTQDGVDYSGCCPGTVVGLAPGGAVWCRVEYREAVAFQPTVMVEGLAAADACTATDGTWVDWSGCCPDGWEYIGIVSGGVVCGVR